MSALLQNNEISKEGFLKFEQYDFAKDKKFQAGLPSIMSRLSKLGSRLDKEIYDREILKAKGFYYNRFISPFNLSEYMAWIEEKKKESAPKCPFAHLWQNKGTQSATKNSGSSLITEKVEDVEGPVHISLSSIPTCNVLKKSHLVQLSQNFREYINEDKITAFILDADCGGTNTVKDSSQPIITKEDRFFCNGFSNQSELETNLQLYLRMAYQLYKLGEKKPTVSFVNGLVDRNAIYLPWLCTDKLITEHARVTFSLSDNVSSVLTNPLAGLFILSRLGQADETHFTVSAKQMPKGIALYLALCPDFVIRGPDIIKLLLGDCFIPSGKSQDLLDSIKSVAGCPPPHTKQAIEVTYYPQNTYPGPSLIEVWRDEIEDCFSIVNGVEEIIERLDKYKNEWARNIRSYLKSQSPTLLKVIFKAISEASALSFEECLKLEYRVAIKFKNTQDYKALQARSSEKGFKDWSPLTLEETSSEYINTFFTPLTKEEGEELDLEYIDQLNADEEEILESNEEKDDSIIENKIGQSVMSQCPVTGLVFAKQNITTNIAQVGTVALEQEETAICPFMNGQKAQGQYPVTGAGPTPESAEMPLENLSQKDNDLCPFLSGKQIEGQCPITGASHSQA